MAYIKTNFDRTQMSFYVDTLDEMIGKENAVRFIDMFVDSLELAELGFKFTNSNSEGQAPFNPADMLKIYIYSYNNKIRSSRRIMRECSRNIELMWLVNKLIPDFRSIARFRADNAAAIKNVFKQLVKFCDDAGIISHETYALDGTKIRAVNSKDKNFTENKLNKRLEMINENLGKYNSLLETADMEETPENELTKEQLQRKIAEIEERKAKYEGYLKQIQDGEITQISETDPESRRMKMSNGGFNVAYNVQAIADEKSHIITEFEVVSEGTDHDQLAEMTEKAKELVREKSIEILADDGYASEKEVKKTIENGDIPNVPTPKKGFFSFEFDNTTEFGVSINNGILPKFLDRSEFSIEDGKLIFKPDKNAYKRRKCIIEHPFGTVKYWNDGSFTLLKGRTKVAADLALQFISYNLKRLLNIKGIEAAMQLG
jgi:transposase